MKSLWALRNISWVELGKRVWKETNDDRMFGRAAELSYYFLLALFPLLIFLTSVIGLVLGSGTGTRHVLYDYLARIMPPSAYQLISTTMYEVSNASGGGKISFGLLAALWAASNGMGAITESLNIAYDVEESRPWWKARLVAISLTIALSVLIIAALVLVVFGGRIGEGLANAYGLGSAFAITWKIVQWPVVLAFMILAFALIYYFAPDLRRQAWQWLTPGAAIGVALWLLVSLAFRVYLHFFDSYSATYGSLGAVIILMLWLYFTGAAILIGGEINSEIENAAAEQGAPEAKERGEKSPQENETRRAGATA
ncbi:MAG TPA: YihY/virulence factor BrkB family protein [Pyrinomonadaceae bacterium]|nr:YihY/virulence factor BrkB family protein [Pyrinomonadaceae bacterium]